MAGLAIEKGIFAPHAGLHIELGQRWLWGRLRPADAIFQPAARRRNPSHKLVSYFAKLMAATT